MAHFGLICPPGRSHVTGLAAIGRVLKERGHEVTVFNIPDVEVLARTEGLEFHPIGAGEHPRGSFQTFSDRLARLSGLAALKYGLQVAAAEIRMLLAEAPKALQSAGVTALLVDQGQPAGSTIAEFLGIPFFSVCNAPSADSDPWVPPSYTGWLYSGNWAFQLRNRMAHAALHFFLRPLKSQINVFRARHKLPTLSSLDETFSPRAIISQQTREFDFPRKALPNHFHYIGLLRRSASAATSFPFERLNGKPLVYATFGTVLTAKPDIFSILAEVCSDLNVQLAISLGGRGNVSDYAHLPGSPIVVNYAPQAAVLERAALVLCHSGNNTVLESLAAGVPVLAIPVCFDQPGVAARLVRSGAGERIRLGELNITQVRRACSRLLTKQRYRDRAKRIGCSIQQAGGERRAADIIEAVIS